MSELELKFLDQIRAAGLPEPHREFMFSTVKGWRFDFAWLDTMIAVEVEGGIYSRGRHVRGAAYEDDCIKYNDAQMRGWVVLRFGPNHINGRGRKPNKIFRGIEDLRRAMEVRKKMGQIDAKSIGNVVLEESDNSFTGWVIKMDGSEGVPASIGEVALWRLLREQSIQIAKLREHIRQLDIAAANRLSIVSEVANAEKV